MAALSCLFNASKTCRVSSGNWYLIGHVPRNVVGVAASRGGVMALDVEGVCGVDGVLGTAALNGEPTPVALDMVIEVVPKLEKHNSFCAWNSNYHSGMQIL